MLGEVSEEPRFSDVAKAAAHYGLCHVSYLRFKLNLFFVSDYVEAPRRKDPFKLSSHLPYSNFRNWTKLMPLRHFQ